MKHLSCTLHDIFLVLTCFTPHVFGQVIHSLGTSSKICLIYGISYAFFINSIVKSEKLESSICTNIHHLIFPSLFPFFFHIEKRNKLFVDGVKTNKE